MAKTFNIVDAYEYMRAFYRMVPDFDQDYAVGRLIWYLNSGGRRSWTVVERPDNVERNLPRPDYVCWEKHTGAYITVEIKRILHDPEARKIEEFRKTIWYEIARRVDGQLPGTFILGLPARMLIKQRNRPNLIDSMVTQVTDFAPTMQVFESRPLSFNLSLFKMSDEGASLLGPVVDDHPENNPTVMMSCNQAIEAIEKPLAGAAQKLSAYAKGVRAVVLDNQFFLEELDVYDAMEELDPNAYNAIDRLYLLNVGYRGRLMRAW